MATYEKLDNERIKITETVTQEKILSLDYLMILKNEALSRITQAQKDLEEAEALIAEAKKIGVGK